MRAVESRGAGCTVVQMKHKGNNIYPDRRLGEVIHQDKVRGHDPPASTAAMTPGSVGEGELHVVQVITEAAAVASLAERAEIDKEVAQSGGGRELSNFFIRAGRGDVEGMKAYVSLHYNEWIDRWMKVCVVGCEGLRTVPGSGNGKRAWLGGLNDTLFLLLQMVG